MLRIAEFTHPGAADAIGASGTAPHTDALRHWRQGGTFCAALCDGGNNPANAGANVGASAAVDILLGEIQAGHAPADAMAQAWLQLRSAAHTADTADVAVSAAALCIQGGRCDWANAGDCRVYHFSGERLAHRSVDDSAAYAEYAAGALSYADLRMHPRRGALTAGLGGEAAPAPHGGGFPLAPGDALLLCSDGFWQYIYETEMEADLCKSDTPREWLDAMLLRLAQRSLLQGDCLSALAILYGGGPDDEF